MNKLQSRVAMSYLILFIFSLFACEKENEESEYFTPSKHLIHIMGSKMVLSVEVPQLGEWCNFYSNKDLINERTHLYPERIGLCKNYQVAPAEMEKLAQFLSDTIIFKWHGNTDLFPDTRSCLMLIINDIQIGLGLGINCSFGNDSSTIIVLKELSKAVRGEAAKAFDKIVQGYEDELERSNQPDTIITAMDIPKMASRYLPDFKLGKTDSIYGKYLFYYGNEKNWLRLDVGISNSVERARVGIARALLYNPYHSPYNIPWNMEQGSSEEFSIGYKYWIGSDHVGKLDHLVFTRGNVDFIFDSPYSEVEMFNLAKGMDDDIVNKSVDITFGIESP